MATVKSSRSETSRSRGSKMKDEIEKSSSRSTGRGGDLLPKIGKEQEEKPVGDFDDMMSHPVMFGDPFGNRGDYSKGIFYGGRSKFLHSKDSKVPTDKTPNALEPPLDFMTVRQRRNKAEMSKTQVQLISKRLDFKRKDDNDEAAILARAEAKKNLQQSKCKVMVIKHQATSKYDWTVQRQAGCKFWVHKPTGTISSEAPFCEDEDHDQEETEEEGGRASPLKPSTNTSTPTTKKGSTSFFDMEEELGAEEQEEAPATGSLVYDSYEFNNFLNILDEMQSEEVSKKAKNKARKARK